MKKYLLAAAAVAALGSAAPATAQVGNVIQQGLQGLLGGGGISGRLATLESQIASSFQRGEISQAQASRLQNELVQLRERDRMFRVDGLNRTERAELQQRLQVLERRVQQARLNRDGRFDRDERFDRDDRRFGRNDCPPGLAKKNNGCMPPGQAKKQGQRYDRNWGGVPSQWQDQYRDTNRYMYRYDGNRIYQVDRRTGNIVRVINRR